MKNETFSRRNILRILAAAPFVAPLLGSSGATVKADQPHMEKALDALRTAKRELNDASSDKGGHRARALGFVEKAINEVERGIKFDRRR